MLEQMWLVFKVIATIHPWLIAVIVLLYITNGLTVALLRNLRQPDWTPTDWFVDLIWFVAWPLFLPGELTTNRPPIEDEDNDK